MTGAMISLGLDLSLTGTGVSVLKDGQLLLSETIKTKPSGKKPIDEVKRLQWIVSEIMKYVDTHTPNIVIIEGLAFMARNTTALVQLSGLAYMIRSELVNRGIPFTIVAPSSLKKWITGKGNAQKNEMMLATFQRYGVALTDDNQCDSYGLAHVGLGLLGVVDPSLKLTKPQLEVISLLSTQL